MSYKDLIKRRETRIFILRMLSWVPDKVMLKWQYRLKTQRKLNLKTPKRYSEKLQWYKLYYRDPKMQTCSDKYLVREYVKNKGLGFLLNDLYGVYKDAEEIDFDKLPDKFVLKLSNGGGGNNLIFCDKDSLNKQEIVDELKGWKKLMCKNPGREWVYDKKENYIIAEKILERNSRNDLPDYKFFCFNGEPYCLYTMIDYTDNHENGKLSFFDMNFNKMKYHRNDFQEITENIDKPENFDKMIEYARILSKDFPHVRVDFYNIDGKIVFGELTFFNASGYMGFEPDEFDLIMGEKFVLPEKNK